MVSFSWTNVKQQIEAYNKWVVIGWYVQWLLALCLSRFARYKARQEESEWWTSFCLLPVYEIAIAFRKLGFLGFFLVSGFSPAVLGALVKTQFTASAAVAAYFESSFVILILLTDISVVYVLCSRSGGTTTLWSALVLTFTLSFTAGAVAFFELAGAINLGITVYNIEHNDTLSFWPSFSGGAGLSAVTTAAPTTPFVSGPQERVASAISFWLMIALAVVGTAAILAGTLELWCPRKPGLAGAMYMLLLLTLLVSYLSYWIDVKDRAFGFVIFALFGIIEMPFAMYVMLLDSRYWTSLSLTGDNSPVALDELKRPNVSVAAIELHSIKSKTGWRKVLHIHFSSLTVNKAIRLGQGSTASVYSGNWRDAKVAVKVMLMRELVPEELGGICHELMVSSQLSGHENIVQLRGFSMAMPYIYIVMEQCHNDLHTWLHYSEVPRLVSRSGSRPHSQAARYLACGSAAGVAHLHSMALVHRDVKSPNIMVAMCDSQETAKLADFGETIRTDDAANDANKGLIGSANWLAPELLYVPREYSQSADVFALALVCYECMTQQMLGSHFMDYHHKHTTGYGKGKSYKDWLDFLQMGHRPCLENCKAEWGAIACDAVQTAWSADACCRGNAEGLWRALVVSSGVESETIAEISRAEEFAQKSSVVNI